MYDYKTKNSSFINLHLYLKNKGINNNAFFLVLIDEELQGVNPHSTDLSIYFKKKIINECRNNFWYFYREILRTPINGGVIQFPINIASLSTLYLSHNSIDTHTVSPVNTLRTLTASAFILYNMIFEYNNSINLISRVLDDSYLINSKIKQMIELIPKYFGIVQFSKYPNNCREMHNKHLFNKFKISSTAKTSFKADMIGRNLDGNIIVINDAEYIKYLDLILEANAPIRNKIKTNLVNEGLTHAILTNSTVCNDKEQYKVIDYLISNSYKWDIKYFDHTIHNLCDIFNSTFNDLKFYIEFHADDIFSNYIEWVDDMSLRYNGNTKAMASEVFLKRKIEFKTKG